MTRWPEKFAAIVRRDLKTALRYRAGLLLSAGGTLLELAAFYFLARAIGPGFRPEGHDYFPYLLVGTGLYTFLLTGANSFLGTVQEAQQTGTLEVLMTTSTPAPVLVLLSAFSSFAGKVAPLVLYLGVGLAAYGLPGNHPNLVAAGVVFALALAIAAALGIFAAGVQVATQRGSAVIALLGSLWFLTGTMFPVDSLPTPLRLASQAIPLTHVLTGMRLALLGGAGSGGLGREILLLGGFAAILLPLSVFLFSVMVRRARVAGSLSFY
jgi:ABC-2 type transport system permease protein